MEAVRLSPVYSSGNSARLYNETHFRKLIAFKNNSKPIPSSANFSSSHSHQRNGTKRFKLYTATSPSPLSTGAELETPEGNFDWYSEWYPVMPVCDLDMRVPHAKTVIGLDVVVWWDRNENQWKVFDDSCPHRLAPLSEGRIDQWGRLQCVYHGWCFNGSGDCKLIPQAPPEGPPVHTFKKACAIVYPSTVQHGVVWFWPNSDPQFKDILMQKKPPYIPEIEDPSFIKPFGNRDIPYGYEILIENLMDPAHVPYAHYGIMQTSRAKNPLDREGGKPLELAMQSSGPNGFTGKQLSGTIRFFAPCVFYLSTTIGGDKDSKAASQATIKKESAVEKKLVLVFICVPVSPGKSRLIWTFPRNFGVWMDKVIPRWIFHIGQNLILDSDLYLLHVEEHKIMDVGPENWQKACFVPTKSDVFVVGFRKWLKKYGGGQVNWRGRFISALPPTPPREQLMDRYWTHVVNCSSCKSAYKSLKIMEIVLQVMAVSVIGIVAATKHTATSSMLATTPIVSFAVVCFAASKWLSHFIHKVFHYHDYNHAFR